MNHRTRRLECSPLVAGIVAAGLAVGLCGCAWRRSPPLLDTRAGIVPPPYQFPAATMAVAAPAPASAEPLPPAVLPEFPTGTSVVDFAPDVPGPAAPEEKEAAPAAGIVLPPVPEVKQITYTVKKNDSLWVIGRQHGITYQEIAAANNLDANAVLKEGTVLVIPPGGRPGAASEGRSATVRTPAPATATVGGGATGLYTVQRGDCLSKVAARHKMKTADLRKLNELSDDRIFIGQKLKVSGQPVAAPAAERPKIEQPKIEQPRIEQPRIEQPRIEQPRIEQPRIEQPKIEQPKIEQPGTTEPATGATIPAVPAGVEKAGVAGPAAPEVLPAPVGGMRRLPHDICKDDTLENIAEIYGTTVTAILQANPTIKSNADLEEGKTIMVPYK